MKRRGNLMRALVATPLALLLGNTPAHTQIRIETAPAIHQGNVWSNQLLAGRDRRTVRPSKAYFPVTTEEKAVHATVVNHALPPGVVLRYETNALPGTTDMTLAIQTAIDSNSTVYLPAAVYRITRPLTLRSSLTIFGDGKESVITSEANIDSITAINKKDIVLRDLAVRAGASSVPTDAIHLSGCSNVHILRLDISGVSDQGVMATAGSKAIVVEDSYFHDWQNKVADSADISFYNNATDSKAIHNRCEGGGDHGIRFQLTSNRNVADGNLITSHARYGILAGYEAVVPTKADNVIVNNQIRDITGLGLISQKALAGAGIYGVMVGGLVVRNNTVENTNINTAVETLTPAAIGIAAPYSDSVIEGNRVSNCHWYGIAVFSNKFNAKVAISDNVIAECRNIGIYAKNFGNVTIRGNRVSNVSQSRTDGIVAFGQSDPVSDVVIADNHLRGGVGGMYDGIRLTNVRTFVVRANQIERAQGRGLHLISTLDGKVEENAALATIGPGLRLSDCDRVSAIGGKYHSIGTYSIEASGRGTKNRLMDADLAPFVVGNFADAGLTISSKGPGVPASGTWVAGDTVYFGHSKDGLAGAVCVRSGTPGTWRIFGSAGN
jgi:hypothetical protein